MDRLTWAQTLWPDNIRGLQSFRGKQIQGKKVKFSALHAKKDSNRVFVMPSLSLFSRSHAAPKEEASKLLLYLLKQLKKKEKS